MRPHGSPEELQRRRMRAIALLDKGTRPVDVARIIGVDGRTVRMWNAKRREGGASALNAKPASGRPPKLTDKIKKRLVALLMRGAVAAGYPTNLWTCPRVAQAIENRFGVHYAVDHVGPLLRGMAWSPQKPERRAIERDEDGIRTWLSENWPRLKKKPPAGKRIWRLSTKAAS